MKNIAAARHREAHPFGLFAVVALWLIVSSVYYVDTVLTGRFAMEADEGLYHKAFKYLVTFSLSLFLAIRFRMWMLLSLTMFLAIQALIVQFSSPESKPIVDVYIVLMCMSGLVVLLRVLGTEANSKIPRLIVSTGVLVGVVSIVEIFLLSDLFLDRWASTGGMRSISTLFNPNNLGLYLGVCAIFLFSVDYKPYARALAAIPIAFGLVFSGSRTAWLALFGVALFSVVYSVLRFGNTNVALLKPKALLLITFVSSLLAGVYALLTFVADGTMAGIELRGLDTYTADVRKENLLEYIRGLGWNTLVPDLYARNTNLTSDSAYLILLNSFGALPLVFYTVLVVTLYRVDLNGGRPFSISWHYVVAFYLIAALADSTTNAFPNNQMFFIALGSLLKYRFTGKPAC